MEFVNTLKDDKNNQELATEKMSFTSTLKSLKEMGFVYVNDLGIGKFGKVVEMLHPNTKTTCAVKIVKEENISDGELHTWSSLWHENILPLISFNYIAQDRTFIFITKKCQSSLDKKLGDVELIFDSKALEKVISWMQDVAKGLAFLHERNMAHMDIKSNNVLISNDGRAVLTDFGSLTSFKKPTSAYTSPLPYRPPETYAVDGCWEPVDGLKYDSWAFGMMCIRVLTRENFCQNINQHKNFWPKKMYPMLFDILQRKRFASKMKTCFPRSQNCREKVDVVLNLIKACLQLDPQKRITVKEALKHRLFGGQVFYELEENSPWNEKTSYQEMARLIYKMKLGPENTYVFSEECNENDNVKETNVDAKEKYMVNANTGKKKNVGPLNKVEKPFTDKETEIGLGGKMPVSTKKVAICDTSVKDEKTLCDGKINKQMAAEVILTAHTLFDDVKSQGGAGIYLKELDSRVNQVPELKRMNKLVDWARRKKNSFSKMFAPIIQLNENKKFERKKNLTSHLQAFYYNITEFQRKISVENYQQKFNSMQASHSTYEQ